MTMAVDEDGEFGYRPLFSVVLDALNELRGTGLLTDDELHRMSSRWFRAAERDFFAPFAPSGRFEQLEIDHLEVFNAEDRFWAQYQVDSDATAFGAAWAAFARASVFPTLAAALEGGRNDPRRRSSSINWRRASRSGWRPRPSRCRSAGASGAEQTSEKSRVARHAVAESVAVVQRRHPGEPTELLAEVGR